jgi:hypothetical protein
VREDNYQDNRMLRWSVQATLVGLLLLAARRSDVHDSAILSLALVFALAVSSRYYGAMYGLLLLRGAQAAPRAPPLDSIFTRTFWRRAFSVASFGSVRRLDVAFFFVLSLSYIPALFGADVRTLYMLSNVTLMAYLVTLLVYHGLGTGGRAVSAAPVCPPAAASGAAA